MTHNNDDIISPLTNWRWHKQHLSFSMQNVYLAIKNWNNLPFSKAVVAPLYV